MAGQKIAAIKAYREATGAGLKEAKDAVEAIEAELHAKWPGKFELAPRGGCLGMVFIVVCGAATGWIIWGSR